MVGCGRGKQHRRTNVSVPTQPAYSLGGSRPFLPTANTPRSTSVANVTPILERDLELLMSFYGILFPMFLVWVSCHGSIQNIRSIVEKR